MAKNLFLTGGTGFIGKNFLSQASDYKVTLALPSNQKLWESPHEIIGINEIPKQTWGPDWGILHFAAEMQDKGGRRLKKINTELTLRLAHKAIEEQAQEFIFLSDAQLSLQTKERIEKNPFLMSKLRAENGLIKLFEKKPHTRLTILRLPDVYGPNNKESQYALFRLAQKKIKLPLGSITSKKSRLYVGNLISAILLLIQSPQPGYRAKYNLADAEPISIGEFYKQIFSAFHEGEALTQWPLWSFRALAGLLSFMGKFPLFSLPFGASEVRSVLSDQILDCSPIRQKLGWTPPIQTHQGILETLKWYSTYD